MPFLLPLLSLLLLVAPCHASPEDPESIVFASQVATLGTLLRDAAGDELGLDALRGLFGQRHHSQQRPTAQEKMLGLAAQLETKLDLYSEIVKMNALGIEKILESTSITNGTISCCDVKQNVLKLEANFGTYVSEAFACQLAGDAVIPGAHNISELMRETHSAQGRLKWQYFVSVTGSHLEYPATRANGCATRSDSRHRSASFAAFHPTPKYVGILFDRGSAMSPNQVDVGRAILQYVSSTLSENDFFGLIAVADDVYHPLSPDCHLQALVRASLSAKIELSKFINVVQASKSATDHVKGFQAMQEMINNSNLEADATVHVLYVTRGHLAKLTEKETVFQTLAALRGSVKQQIVINSYATVDSSKSQSPFEFQYLEQIASQTFSAHNLTVEGPVVQGQFVQISSADDVATEIGDWVRDDRKAEKPASVLVLPPSWDAVGQGTVISLTSPIFVQGQLSGISGIDVHLMEDLLEDVLAFDNQQDLFVCVVQRYGSADLRIIFHPSVSDRQNTKMSFMELEEAEKLEDMDDLRDRILAQQTGSKVCKRWSRSTDSFSEEYLVSWKWVKSDFIVMLFSKAMHTEEGASEVGGSLQQLDIPPLYYQHRQDGSPSSAGSNKENNCRHFRCMATFKSGSLYLSPFAFSSFTRDSDLFSDSRQRNAYAYLTDNSRLIANPGLKENVREDVTLLSQLIFTWKNRSSHSFFTDRYAGMTSGVYVSYPGIKMPAFWEFSHQSWFTNALEYPGRVVLSGPKLQKHGAGYVVSLSQSLSEQVPSATVVGIDIPLAYLEKLITDNAPECLGSVTCFLMDQRGSLIYHPLMTEPTYLGPLIDQHLNHKEPSVGKDLINFSSAVRKATCKSLLDDTTRHYYEFNTDLKDVVTNVIQGHGCNSIYRVTAVPGTNLLFGIIYNSTCQSTAVFCPCNINSRKCLICPISEMDEGSCECPCDCPLREDLCSVTRQEATSPSHLPVCKKRPVEEAMLFYEEEDIDIGYVEPCFPVSCSAMSTKNECTRFPGCAWCQVELEVDKEELESPSFSPLTHPYCTDQVKCFRGALGSPNPYDARGRGKMLRERSEAAGGSTRSPVGPIIGGVLVFFLFLAFSVFCYRQRFGGSGDEHCGGRIIFRSPGENTLGGNIEVEDDEEMHGHHNTIALNAIDNATAAVISPYRMNPGYRRPPPGTDSDHGYSTMTPLGGDLDSEIMPYTASGPARDRLRHRPPPSQHSVTSGVSSRTSSPAPSLIQQQLLLRSRQVDAAEEKRLLSDAQTSSSSDEASMIGQTVLNPNQFVVSATVHVDSQ